jgi:GNAT superfamily N-acetyltransferase
MFRPPTLPPTPTNPKLRVERVESADALADFERTIIEAYPVPELQPWQRESFLHPGVLDTRWRFFVGYDDDRCVATAGAFVTDTITVVEQVSVRDECRGNGYGAAITAAATHAEPGRTAMLIASDLGRPTYDQLGYVTLLRFTLHIGMRLERAQPA